MTLRSTPLLVGISLLGGCALIYNYGDYGGAGGAGRGGGTGGASTAATTASTGGAGTSSTTSTSSGGTSSSSTSTSSTSSSSSSGTCASPLVCATAPAIPSPWLGPVVLETSTAGAPPACSAPWDQTAVSGGTGVAAGTCSCTCSPPTTPCPNLVIGVASYTDNFCASADDGGTVSVGSSCKTGVHITAAEGEPFSPTAPVCTGSAPMLTSATFTAWASVCTGASAEMCSGGWCVPSGQAVCFYSQTSTTCPTGYSVKAVLYETPSQSGNCGACVCAPTSPGTCTPTLRLFTDGSCGADAGIHVDVPLDGTCQAPKMGSFSSAQLTSYGGMPTNATCGSGTSSAAALTPAGGGKVTTVCCTN